MASQWTTRHRRRRFGSGGRSNVAHSGRAACWLLQVCDEVYFDPGAGQTSVWITRLTVSDPISTPPEEEPVAPDGRRWPHLLALIAVLGLTLGARILWLPKPLEPRQVDE